MCYNHRISLSLIVSENSRSNIDPQKHVLIFLWFSGHETSSYRDVADRFDVCLSSLHDVITRMITFLSSLASEFIKFSNIHEKQATKTFYHQRKGFPNIIGNVC